MVRKHTAMAQEKNVSELMVAFLYDSGYLKFLEKRGRKEDFDHISQFYNKIKAFEEANVDASLKRFIDELNLEIESGEEGKLEVDVSLAEDAVKIMTVHAAKGLEFAYVFLVDLVDRKFPTVERKEQIEIPAALSKDQTFEGDAHLEEERRLFYVGMTRAKRGLFFASAKDYGGATEKKISRFLAELGYDGNGKTEEVKNIKVNNYKKKPPRLALPDHFSFTQLAAFEKCPKQYQYAHIWRIKPKGKAVFSFGKTMHNALHQGLLEAKGAPSFELLKAAYDRNWIDEWYDDHIEKGSYYRLGLKSLKLFARDFKARKPKILSLGGVPALEVDFHFKVDGHTIYGKIDRIDEHSGGVEIIDYKTGSVKEKLRPEDKQQLLIYHIAAKEVFDLNPKKLTYYYLEQGRPTSFVSTDTEAEAQKEKIAVLIKTVETSDFRAKPGWQCDWCDFRDICEFAKK